MTHHDEEQSLIARASKGDKQAYQALVERYQQQVYRAAYLILRDPDEAQEAAQEAFIRGYKAMRKFKKDQPFRPWIHKIAVNQSLTAARKRSRRQEVPAEALAIPADFSIDETVIDKQRAEMLIAALADMREKDRVVINPVADATTVDDFHGQAFWLEGLRVTGYQEGAEVIERSLRATEANTLVFDHEGRSYRIEGNLSLEEAVLIAQSLR